MSLTTGRGPLSATPAGRFVPPLPGEFSYVEPFRRRVRAYRAGVAVVDSERVLLVHRRGEPPAYAFPMVDVHLDAADTAPELLAEGCVRVAWAAVDEWYEEDTQVFGHPRNPYHRIDCLAAQRRLVVTVNETALVDTTDTTVLYETALAPRLYVSAEHVRTDLLQASATTTYCPYKGTAHYFDAVIDGTLHPDIAWSYPNPIPESTPIAGMLCFDPARASVSEDLPAD